MIDAFSERSGITVERKWSEQSELKVSLLEMMELGNAPDVVLVPSDHIGLHKLMGYSEIDPAILNHPIKDSLWESARSDGGLFGIPIIQGNQLMLYFNRRFVNAPAKSWAEIRAQRDVFLSASIRAASDKFMAWNYDEMYWFAPFLGAFGGWPIEGGKLALNSSAMTQALEFYKALGDDEITHKDCDYACAFDAFINGDLVYTINGDWALNDFQTALGTDLGIASIPSIDPHRPARPMFLTHVLAFPKQSIEGPKRDALIKFINYLQSPEVQKALWEELQILPVHPDAHAHALATASPNQLDALSTLKNARSVPADSAMTFAWSAMRKGFLRHQTDVMSAKEAAELMQTFAEKQIENY
jgi:maltose-binding protein MalE